MESLLSTLRRDLQTMWHDLRDSHRKPYMDRSPLPRHQHQISPGHPDLAKRQVVVLEVCRETKDAVTLILGCKEGRPFVYKAGQFLTVILNLDGEEVRRAYSICRAPGELPSSQLAITCKRVASGRVSNYINDHLLKGDTLRVLGPSGNFVLHPDDGRPRRIVLLGGGSGITPLRSLAEAVLKTEPGSQVVLLYGNRSVEDVVFAEPLAKLAEAHGERFVLRHLLDTDAKQKGVSPSALFEEELLQLLAGASAFSALPTFFYLCGPDGMRTSVRETLNHLGVSPSTVLEERFASRTQSQMPLPQTPQLLSIKAQGKTHDKTQGAGQTVHDTMVQPGQTLLTASLQSGAPLPYSCAMGGCGTCRVRVLAGEVVSEEPNCLSQEEKDQGYVLGCVSRPLGALTVEIP